MKTASLLAGSLTLLLLSTGGSSSVTRHAQTYRFNYENVLGTSLDLKILATSEPAAEKAQQAALDEIDRQAKILSGYDSTSEFSRWMKTKDQAVPVSPELFEVLGLFDRWRDATGGALDASAETVTRVWKKAASEQRMPTASELAAAVETVHRKHWLLNGADHTATHLSDAPLVLNSFAKSYIVNHAAEAAMHTEDVTGAVVNIGGDLVVRGALTEPVDIADPYSDAENSEPLAHLSIHDRAVATSGNYRRGVEIGGQHYSHIVDPRTGQTAEEIVSSTVVAPDPATAGALATAFSVMKPAESMQLAALMPNVDFLIVKKNGERVASRGWRGLAMPFAPMPAAAGTAGSWDPSMELTVHLEVARIDGYRVRRPYVAVWIEDQDKFPVKTIALWMEKAKYLNEMRAWYKDDRLRSMAEGSDITRSVSGATRPPGKYTVKWDGKDNAGKMVKAGKYTVFVEATREHGGYQLMHEELDFTGTPKQVELHGGEELTSASLDYHKVAK
jgi:thiamine biosynthesis lipoprotein